jgi:hypothetical protein
MHNLCYLANNAGYHVAINTADTPCRQGSNDAMDRQLMVVKHIDTYSNHRRRSLWMSDLNNSQAVSASGPEKPHSTISRRAFLRALSALRRSERFPGNPERYREG